MKRISLPEDTIIQNLYAHYIIAWKLIKQKRTLELKWEIKKFTMRLEDYHNVTQSMIHKPVHDELIIETEHSTYKFL